MPKTLVVAAAGAGKSQLLINLARNNVSYGGRVLLLTYTESNQQELVNKFCVPDGYQPEGVVVKGWFTFLLEDLIRPYQRCVFPQRIPAIFFDVSDPHKRNGKHIPGRSIRLPSGLFNPDYFLTKRQKRAHTTYLSKLACCIQNESSGKPIHRLSHIYKAVYIDEVQDLVGWDFDIIDALSAGFGGDFWCVGDFRQTIYRTSCAIKKPQLVRDKLDRFEAAGFLVEHKNISYRCIQSICDLADQIHHSGFAFPPTESKIESIPEEYQPHLGVFAVSEADLDAYLAQYKPIILRVNKSTEAELCSGRIAYNFGEAKGLSFKRVLILPTKKYKKFLAGNLSVFDSDKTDEARNKLYVAITRARYSVAFAYGGKIGLPGITPWKMNR